MGVANSHMHRNTAVRALFEEAKPPKKTRPLSNETLSGPPPEPPSRNKLCALLGPALWEEIVSTAPLAFARRLPQVSFYADYQRTPDEQNLVTGLVPVASQVINYLLDYLQSIGREKLAVVYTAEKYASAVTLRADAYGVKAFKIGSDNVQDLVPNLRTNDRKAFILGQKVRKARILGYRTVLFNVDASLLRWLARFLQAEGMLSDDYLFVFQATHIGLWSIDDLVESLQNGNDTDALVLDMLNGSLIVSHVDQFMIQGEENKFSRHWRSQTSEMVQSVNALVPTLGDDDGAEPLFQGDNDYFQTADLVEFASFVYDAVMLIGLAACNEYSETQIGLNGTEAPPSEGLAPTLPAPGAGTDRPSTFLNGTQPNLPSDETSIPPAGSSLPPPSGTEPMPSIPDSTSLPPDSNGTRPPPVSDSTRPPLDSDGTRPSLPSDSGTRPPPDGARPPPLNGTRPPRPDDGLNRLLRHEEGSEGTSKPPPLQDDPKSNSKLGEYMKTVEFKGASGFMGPKADGSRKAGFYMGVFNLLVFDGTVTVNLAASLETGAENEAWVPAKAFVYRSGSLEPPSPQQVVSDNNYLGSTVRIIALVMLGVSWFLSAALGVLTIVMRNERVVRAGQPVFMVLLCGGSIVLSASIFTLSFDEGAGWTESQLDIACTLTPWFFFVGHIISFLAVFSKLYRLDKVTQFRRGQTVMAHHVLSPLVVFLTATVAILVVWTVVDPWHWERTTISVFPPETYGECTNDHWWAFFGPLMGLIIAAEVITAYFAYKSTRLPEQFDESNSVFHSIFTHLQAWVLGVPILTVIGTSSSDATYFGRVALIWIFSVSSVLVMVGPRLYEAFTEMNAPKHAGTKVMSQIRISGLKPGRGSGGSGDNVHLSGLENTSSRASGGDHITTRPSSRLFAGVSDARDVEA